jgi:hypothetical protein
VLHTDPVISLPITRMTGKIGNRNAGTDENAVSAPVCVILIVILTLTLVAVAVPQFWQFIAGLIWPNLASIDASVIETPNGGQAIEVVHQAGQPFSLGSGEGDGTLPLITIECQRPDDSMARAILLENPEPALFTPGTRLYLFTIPGQQIYMTTDRAQIPEGVYLDTGTWRVVAVDEENDLMIAEIYLDVGAAETTTGTQTGTPTDTTPPPTAAPLEAALALAAIAAIPFFRRPGS